MIGPIKTVTVYVEDQEKALDFYVDKLGFTLRRRQTMGPSAHWLEVSPPNAETCLVLYPRAMMPPGTEFKVPVVFHCPDVETTCRQLESAGVRITMQPKSMAWGMFAAFSDMDGNEFGLTSQEVARSGAASASLPPRRRSTSPA